MQTYTIRPVLWTRKERKDGLSPLMICLTIQRKRTYIKTPYNLTEGQWDAEALKIKNVSNEVLKNAELNKQIADLEKEIISRQLEGKTITAQSIKHSPSTNFYLFVKDVKGQSRADKKESNRILAYAGEHLQLSDIDVVWLRRYEQHQRKVKYQYKGERKTGFSQNTINSTFKWLRRVFKLAVKEGYLKTSPILDYDLPKYVQSERVFLSDKERVQWFTYWKEKKVDGSYYITLTYFLIGVFSGLRYQDWGEATSRINGKFIRLQAKKNKQWIVLPIGKSLGQLLKVAKKLPPPFSGDKTRDHLTILAGILGTKKHITTHVGKHSFCAMCAELRIPKSVAAELVGVSVQTINVYYHLTGQNIIEQAAALKDV